MAREADFPPAIKEVAAKRSAYRCSVPDCRQVTIGPGATGDDIACIGRCCHIFSSSPDGPRGSGGLTESQRASASNAFWACANHAALIDTNDGDRFPPQLLLSWKDCHEALVMQELKGITSRFGWLECLTFHKKPVEHIPTTVRFGKLTILRGGCATGKTTVCECLSALADPSDLWRWRQESLAAMPISYNVTYRTPERHELKLGANGGIKLEMELDNQVVPIQPFPFKVVYCRANQMHHELPDESDLAYIGRVLHLDEGQVINLLPLVAQYPALGVQQLRPVECSTGINIVGDLSNTEPNLGFRALSHGEQVRVVHSIAVACARFYARYFHTLLILDGGMSWLDRSSLESHIQALRNAEHPFQTILTTFPERYSVRSREWGVVDFPTDLDNQIAGTAIE